MLITKFTKLSLLCYYFYCIIIITMSIAKEADRFLDVMSSLMLEDVGVVLKTPFGNYFFSDFYMELYESIELEIIEGKGLLTARLAGKKVKLFVLTEEEVQMSAFPSPEDVLRDDLEFIVKARYMKGQLFFGAGKIVITVDIREAVDRLVLPT